MFELKTRRIGMVFVGSIFLLLLSSLTSMEVNSAVSVSAESVLFSAFSPQPRSQAAVSAAELLTNTLKRTFTETFDSYQCQSEEHVTTAAWNIADGQIWLPKLSTVATQDDPAMVVGQDGHIYIVWVDDRNGANDADIYMQKLDTAGRPLWPGDLRVNGDQTTTLQTAPEIIEDSSGNLIVVWQDRRNQTSTILAQKITPDGEKVWSTDKRVDQNSQNYEYEAPAVVLIPNTNEFIVAWHDTRNGDRDVFMQRLNADGNLLWAQDLLVNTDTSEATNRNPSLSIVDNTVYIAWWQTTGVIPDGPVYAQKILIGSQSGIHLWNDDALVSNESDGGETVITADDNGNSYIVWNNFCTCSFDSMRLQKIDSSGLKPDEWPEPITINSNSGRHTIRDIALDGEGNIVLGWAFRKLDASPTRDFIFVQKFDAQDGAEKGTAVQVNHIDATQPYPNRSVPTLAISAVGNIHVVWGEQSDTTSHLLLQTLTSDLNRLWLDERQVDSNEGILYLYPKAAIGANNQVVFVFGNTLEFGGFPDYSVRIADTFGNLFINNIAQVNKASVELVDHNWIDNTSSIATHPDGSIIIVWHGGHENIYLQKIHPDGTTLSKDVLVGQSHGVDQPRPQVAVTPDGDVYVVWQDAERDPAHIVDDIVMQKFTGESLTPSFASPKRVHVDDVIESEHAKAVPSIAYDSVSDSLFVAWQDNRSGASKIYAQRLSSNGDILWAEDLAVSSRSGAQAKPQIVTAAGSAYVFWIGTATQYGQKVTLAGELPWGEQGITKGNGDRFSVSAQHFAGVDYLYLAWASTDSPDKDILLSRINVADGSDLWAEPTRVNSDTGWADQHDPRIAVDTNGFVFVTWLDYRNGRPDLWAQKIPPAGGVKLWPEDVQLNPLLYQSTAEAFSCNINETTNDVTWATLTVDRQLPTGTSVSYLLSNNGGGSWEQVFPNVPHEFKTVGNDVRWRIVFGSNADQTQTAVVNNLSIEYTTGPVPPRSVSVIDENDDPMLFAKVYRNGQLEGTTDDTGIITLQELNEGDTLVALQLLEKVPSARDYHDLDGEGNNAYLVYLTSAPVTDEGEVEAHVVQNADLTQTLVVRPQNPLFLFNLVVSIEWDASTTYMAEIQEAMRLASDYLYDFTDGQMALGQVAIYANKEHWEDADIQILAKNNVRPHAYIGGLLSDERHHVIRLGRQWDGLSGNNGRWDHPFGYRTIAHEFGHYGLFLYDEYFGYEFNNQGFPTARIETYCTGIENRDPNTYAANGSVMDYHYTSSELSHRLVALLWSVSCEETAQFQLNNGESSWETVLRVYVDETAVPRWEITTPHERGGLLAGPNELPDNILAVPFVTTYGGNVLFRPQLTVVSSQGQPLQAAIVSLHKGHGRQIIGQGLSDGNGRITIYGAEVGDTLRAITIDGSLAGQVQVNGDNELVLTLNPIGDNLARNDVSPSSVIRAVAGADPNQIDLLIGLDGLGQEVTPMVIVTKPDSDVGLAPPLNPVGPEIDSYVIETILEGEDKGSGQVQIMGFVEEDVHTQIDYRLQLVENTQTETVFSNDGQLQLRLFANSLPSERAYFVVAPPVSVTSNLPENMRVVGTPYDITAGDVAILQKEAVLTLSYDMGICSFPQFFSIYYWRFDLQDWEYVDSHVDPDDKTLTTTIKKLGMYTLLESSTCVYMPLVSRN